MKTTAKPKEPIGKGRNNLPKNSTTEELKTDYPLSEKDEIKLAEARLKKSQKKNG